MKDFSLMLKLLRKSKGYTQKDLAKLLNLGQTTIANYENGSRLPDIIKLKEIADLFQVPMDYLLNRNLSSNQEYKIDFENDLNYSEYFYQEYLTCLIDCQKDKAIDICLSLLERGMDISKIYQHLIQPSLIEIGILWEKGAVAVWKEHLICEISLDIIRTLHSKIKQNKKNNKTIIALTPGAEQHNIGLKMICSIFELAGFNCMYLGSNIPTKSVLEAINEKKPEIIAISITIHNHIESANLLIEAIRELYSTDSLSIILGGSGTLQLQGVNYTFQDIGSLISQLNKII